MRSGKIWASGGRCGPAGRLIAPALFLMMTAIHGLWALPDVAGAPLGPLYGRNLYAPHLPWYSAPAYAAVAYGATDRQAAGWSIRSALYYHNDFRAYPFDPDDPIYQPLDEEGRLREEDQKDLIAVDYEGLTWEIGAELRLSETWRIGADWRLHARYGGFLDGFIEGLHGLFGLPNAGRMYFDRNAAYWHITGRAGFSIDGEPGVAPGDLDLWTLFTAVRRKRWALAILAACKLPTGSVAFGVGTGWPDLALQSVLHWHPSSRWVLYLQGGLILPMETVFAAAASATRPMVQLVPVAEFRLNTNLSLLLQMNLQSSPFEGETPVMHPLFGETHLFALPQTDVKVGFRGRLRDRLGSGFWQLYVEEDPFTWEGPDILLNFMMEFALVSPPACSSSD